MCILKIIMIPDMILLSADKSGYLMKIIEMLKNISLRDALTTIANGVVSFSFRLLLAIGVFYLGRFLIKKLIQLLNNICTRKKIDLSLTTFLQSFSKILLYFILVVTIIGILGIETSSFLALFASAGVAIGMALSGTLQNFAGGVVILLIHPYKVGDYIEVQGYSGTVKAIQMFHTVITTPDNKTILIPNGSLSTGNINNYSTQARRRVEWSVGISYGDDFAKASETLLAILKSDSRVLVDNPDQQPFVGLSSLGDSAVVLTVRAWTGSADYWPLYFEINRRIYAELPEAGINFPFPQIDVHMKNS